MILPFVREVLADTEKSTGFQRAATHLKGRAGRIRLSGLTPTGRALYLPLLQRAAGSPLLVVVADNSTAEAMLPMVQAFAEVTAACDPAAIIKLPAHDVLPFENLSPHPEIQEERAAALWRIATGQVSIVLAPLEAASMRLRDRDFYAGLAHVVRRGDALDLDEVTARLNLGGYIKADIVEMPGQYATRGGLLDVFPPEVENPLRIELFGDEVESIRRFSPATQRSATAADRAVLLPFTDSPVDERTLAAVHGRLSGSGVDGEREDSAQEIKERIDRAISSGAVTVFPGWEFYATAVVRTQSIFDLMPGALVLVDEPSAVKAESERWWEKVTAMHERSGVGGLVRPEEIYFGPDEWQAMLAARAGAGLEELGIEVAGEEEIALSTQPTPKFHGSVPMMVEEVKRLGAEHKRVVVCAGNMGEVERLGEMFSEYGVPFRMGVRAGTSAGNETYLEQAAYFAGGDLTAATLVKAAVGEGVVLPEDGMVIFGALDLFDESEVVAKRPQKTMKSKMGTFLSDFRDLQVGDFVVHVEHGVAEYKGLKEIAQGDSAGEFMVLEFAEAAKLYVPLTRLDLIQKFRSTEGARPPLSRLGGAQWAKTKSRVKKAMKDMADELLKLYAVRVAAQGHAYAPDNQFVREFDDAFEHTETDDQMVAIADIKRDMESTRPMDRLLCGDVGYGKTEVAMRAAFKAVNDGKQVVVLAPTTVLAFQHYETFKQRFAAFPINVEMISRFRTAKQQLEIVEKVEQSKVDILVGTHRVLSKDIKFADLGLVIVDEEQRFGVRHKERLKQMRKEVDVLTMSATPIPRTLHMSLVGLRDMSLIETPPRDRLAIQTVVAAFDEKLIKSAIENELDRGGQAYFVHNRVESIYEIAAKIQELVPRARVLVGHGQVGEGQLEKTMLAFMRHEADVLVATTIIENGLDIPLCNTILINRADRHGLSELYQLRGRVGRSNRRAYAYLLIPAEKELTGIARRRLAALKEFSDLGAGFKIAALDLELRGAGNLLGGEQSGHIEAVGFEMYTQMLERTVRELKGETEVGEPVHTQLNLGVNLRVPTDYIAEENQRLRMYKRIANVENEQQLGDVRGELVDRYGEPPPPVRHLLDATSLKLVCQRVGVAGVDRKGNVVNIRFTEQASVDPGKLAQFVAANKGTQFTPGGVLRAVLRSNSPEDVISGVKQLLVSLADEPVRVG